MLLFKLLEHAGARTENMRLLPSMTSRVGHSGRYRNLQDSYAVCTFLPQLPRRHEEMQLDRKSVASLRQT